MEGSDLNGSARKNHTKKTPEKTCFFCLKMQFFLGVLVCFNYLHAL